MSISKAINPTNKGIDSTVKLSAVKQHTIAVRTNEMPELVTEGAPPRNTIAYFRSKPSNIGVPPTPPAPMPPMMPPMGGGKESSSEKASAPKQSSQSSAKLNEAISKIADEMKQLKKELNERVQSLVKDKKIDADKPPGKDQALHSKVKTLKDTIEENFDKDKPASFNPQKVLEASKDLSNFLNTDPKYKDNKDFNPLRETVGKIQTKAEAAIAEQSKTTSPGSEANTPTTTPTPESKPTEDVAPTEPSPPATEEDPTRPPLPAENPTAMLDTDKLFAEVDEPEIEPEIGLPDDLEIS